MQAIKILLVSDIFLVIFLKLPVGGCGHIILITIGAYFVSDWFTMKGLNIVKESDLDID